MANGYLAAVHSVKETRMKTSTRRLMTMAYAVMLFCPLLFSATTLADDEHQRHRDHDPTASTKAPSHSSPGLRAQLTGGPPKSPGLFYDDSYDRTLYAPAGNP